MLLTEFVAQSNDWDHMNGWGGGWIPRSRGLLESCDLQPNAQPSIRLDRSRWCLIRDCSRPTTLLWAGCNARHGGLTIDL